MVSGVHGHVAPAVGLVVMEQKAAVEHVEIPLMERLNSTMSAEHAMIIINTALVWSIA